MTGIETRNVYHVGVENNTVVLSWEELTALAIWLAYSTRMPTGEHCKKVRHDLALGELIFSYLDSGLDSRINCVHLTTGHIFTVPVQDIKNVFNFEIFNTGIPKHAPKQPQLPSYKGFEHEQNAELEVAMYAGPTYITTDIGTLWANMVIGFFNKSNKDFVIHSEIGLASVVKEYSLTGEENDYTCFVPCFLEYYNKNKPKLGLRINNSIY